MQNYNATVRLGGNILHEVPKYNITAPEIIILRHTHGDDAVVHIKKVSGKGKSKNLNQKQEIDRLKMIYGEKIFNAVYGGGYVNKLPTVLDDVTTPDLDDEKLDFSTSVKGGDAEFKELQDKLLAD